MPGHSRARTVETPFRRLELPVLPPAPAPPCRRRRRGRGRRPPDLAGTCAESRPGAASSTSATVTVRINRHRCMILISRVRCCYILRVCRLSNAPLSTATFLGGGVSTVGVGQNVFVVNQQIGSRLNRARGRHHESTPAGASRSRNARRQTARFRPSRFDVTTKAQTPFPRRHFRIARRPFRTPGSLPGFVYQSTPIFPSD